MKEEKKNPPGTRKVCTCAICHKGGSTLLKREGAFVCGPCYKRLLMLRTLEKQQKGGKKERAE